MRVFPILQLCIIATLLTLFVPLRPARGEETGAAEGTIVTLWPLFDYRSSPADGFSNLSILGPLFKLQSQKEQSTVAVRPLFFRTATGETAATDYLYPIASGENAPDVSRFQVLKLYQKNTFRKDREEEKERDFMIFPFYITGTSRKYGPYTSVLPIYGDIYERFWRDEYHYVLFPIYGRTVNKGTTNYNVLYPFFSVTRGERESGFAFWPLYGQSAKEGVYRKRFALWPIFHQEEKGLDTDNPTSRLNVLPLYAAFDSRNERSRHYLWPFFGHYEKREPKEEGWDLLWPFWQVVRGEKRNVTRFLPLYDKETNGDDVKRWYLWPLYKEETMDAPSFRQEKERFLYFLYSNNRESWPADGARRQRVAFWPLFVFTRSTDGVKSFGLPAPVEPILDREGIERSWSPLWRIYQQRWSDSGDSAASFAWNLYWHEARKGDLAYEFFPLLRYSSTRSTTDLQLLKGLLRYTSGREGRAVRLFWLPFGISWGGTTPAGETVKHVTGSIQP